MVDARRDPVLWVGLALASGALAVVSPVEVVAGAVAIAGLLARARARPWGRVVVVLAAVAFVVSYGRARGAIDGSEAARSAVLDAGAWPARCLIDGVVSRSPVVAGGGMRLEIDAKDLRCREGPSLAGKVTLHVPLEIAGAHARGDRVAATGSLAPPYRFWNDGTGDPRPTSARRGVVLSGGAEDVVVVERGWGIRWTIDRVRAHMRDRIVATFPPESAPMARALVLGEDDLAEPDQRAFRRSGLAHLLAVSGMHLVLVVTGLVQALRALLVRMPVLAERVDPQRVASAIGLPVAWIYADLAGGSGSAIRAAWMCSVVLLARALGRRAAAWRALGISLVAMALFDPLVAFDVSFVLSALATTGILALSRPIEEAAKSRLAWGTGDRRRVLPAFVVKPLATTAAATIACAPVLGTMAPELPLGGLVANLIAVPLGEAAALPLCLLHGLLVVWPAAESGCAAAASGALLLVRIVARAFTWGALPIPPPTPAELTVMAIVAAGCVFRRPRRWLGGGALALLAIELVVRARGSPNGGLRATFIDVGQGDAALIDLPDGTAMLVDAGGLVGSPIDVGERAVGALLSMRRRNALDVVVLSHPHPDHFLGLASALARAPARAFWDTGQGETEGTAGPYATLLGELRARGVPVLGPGVVCGARAIGGAIVEVLAPCPAPTLDRGANDSSFVVRIRFGERAFLFVGDAEHTEESELLGKDLRADVLKVGHHGSRTSSTAAFVAAVHPSVAVISCGVRNRFGHPSPTTLDTLAHAGARVLRTDRDGSVVVTTDGRSLDVRAVNQVRSTTPMYGRFR